MTRIQRTWQGIPPRASVRRSKPGTGLPRAFVAALFVGMMLVPATAAADDFDPFFTVDGVKYFFAAGARGSGNFSIGPGYNGTTHVPFDGCAMGHLRPDLDNGRTTMVGIGPGGAHLQFDVDEFDHDATEEGGIATDVVVDGGEGNLTGMYPKVKALAAVYGTGILRVNGDPYDDPVTGESRWDAFMMTTANGFRNDMAGSILSTNGSAWSEGPAQVAKDYEMHLRFESMAGANATQPPQTLTFAPEGDLPDGTILPTTTYGENFTFPNTMFGGSATISIQSDSYAVDDSNELSVYAFSPTGRVMGNAILQPALFSPDDAEFAFQLDEFGTYAVLVMGSVSMARYEVEVVLTPPPTASFHAWWENVTYGRDGYKQWSDCLDEVGSVNMEVATFPIVNRPGPPGMLLKVLIATVAAVLLAVTIATRFVSDTKSSASFQKAYKK